VAFASLESLLVVLAPERPVAEATAVEKSSAGERARE
jgi:hypothetical protein